MCGARGTCLVPSHGLERTVQGDETVAAGGRHIIGLPSMPGMVSTSASMVR
jgi:hypothetical protein